jgi:hypothetical protein
MKPAKLFATLFIFTFLVFAPATQAQTTEELQLMINDLLAQVAALQADAEENEEIINDLLAQVAALQATNDSPALPGSQSVTLEPGWNIVSTPKVLESHSFSADENSENFDIYLLDASKSTGWATLTDVGQDTFTPLYGYFIHNKTGVNQTLTFNYATSLEPNEKIFERDFEAEGWYSFGIANPQYAKHQGSDTTDTDNPSKILSLMQGDYDLVFDFTHASYLVSPDGVALNDPWKAVVPEDINNLNDLRETKGYAMYVKNDDATYIGYQTDGSTEVDDPEVVLTGEAVLADFDTDSASPDEIEEGAEYEVAMESVVGFMNGDAIIETIDVAFVGFGDEQDPWDTFKTVSLWIDGDMIAEESMAEVGDYFDDSLGIIRFANLEIIALDDEDVEIIVGVNVENTVEGTVDGEDWTVAINGMQYRDANDVVTTLDSDDHPQFGNTEEFSIIEGGSNDELLVKASSNDPDSATLQLEDDSDSDWYTVFVFDLDTDDSTNDITLYSVLVTVELSASTYNDIVDDAELVIGGVTIDDFVVSDGDTQTAILDFDVNGDVIISAGDQVEAELVLRFNALELQNEGVTVTGSVWGADIDAAGFDDLTLSQLAGIATGETHTLRTQGILVSPESTSAVVTAGDGVGDDYATFEIVVEITAFEQDVFISTDPDVSIDFSLEDSAGSPVPGGQQTAVLTSSADEQGAYFEIPDGQTEILTLTVTYAPGTTQTARLRFNSISFNDVASVPDQVQTTLPQTDYRTSFITIVD